METDYKQMYEFEVDERIAQHRLAESLRVLLEKWEKFHPRAIELLRKQKNFIVIAEDEPYFMQAYATIRSQEKITGRWSDDDERVYRAEFEKRACLGCDLEVVVKGCPVHDPKRL